VGVRELQAKLRTRDQRKARPALSDGPVWLAWRILRTPLRALGVLLPLIGVFFAGDLAAVVARIAASADAGVLRDFLDGLLFLAVPQILLIAVAVLATVLLGRRFLRARAMAKIEQDLPIRLRREAAMIAGEMDVRYVVFGHTHKEDMLRLPGNRWYFNTGTWINVYSGDENMVRAPQQCSYLEISDGSARLRYWDSSSQSPVDAVIIDPEVAHAPAEEDLTSLVRKALRMPWRFLGGPPSRKRLEKVLRARMRRSAGGGKGG
jgi:UDP-2,3-diacylglucosamine pyrophosphatase LpxH